VKAIERLGGWTDDWISLREVLGSPPPVVQASLRGSHVTDAALVHVCNLHYLGHLDLSGTQITDAGLLCLSELPHLKFVRLRDTQVTPKTVKRFQEELPNCTIEY